MTSAAAGRIEDSQGELVSVIVPIYNVEKYLRPCLDSIVCQTYKNLEILLIDDGSTDNSGKICDEYEKRDNRIRVIHKENGGLSDARNWGLRRMTGEYLCFVDSDDVVHERYVEKLFDALKQYDCDVAICATNDFEEDETPDYHAEKEVTILDHMTLMMRSYSAPFTSAMTKLYKKSQFDGIEFPKGKLHEDTFTIYRVFDRAKRAAFVQTELYGYRVRKGSIMHSKYTLRRLDAMEAYEQQLAYFGKQKNVALVCKTLTVYIEWLEQHTQLCMENNMGDAVVRSLQAKKADAMLELKKISKIRYMRRRVIAAIKKSPQLYHTLKHIRDTLIK